MTDEPEIEGSAIVAAGGWCAPASLVYDAMALNRNEFTASSMFPEISVSREWHVPTAEEIRERDAVHRLNQTLARRMAQQVTDAIDRACITALREGYDIHVYYPPQPFDLRHASGQDMMYLAHVGIQFEPAKHPVPTIHEHHTPDWWDDDD